MFFPIHEFFKRSKIQIISWHFQVNILFLYNLETVTFSEWQKHGPHSASTLKSLMNVALHERRYENLINNYLFVLLLKGSSWSYGSWIYDYLCNQCLSLLKLWGRNPFMAWCTRYNIMWQSLSVTCDRSVVFSGYSGFLHQ